MIRRQHPGRSGLSPNPLDGSALPGRLIDWEPLVTPVGASDDPHAAGVSGRRHGTLGRSSAERRPVRPVRTHARSCTVRQPIACFRLTLSRALWSMRTKRLARPLPLTSSRNASHRVCPSISSLLGGSADDHPTRYRHASPAEMPPIDAAILLNPGGMMLSLGRPEVMTRRARTTGETVTVRPVRNSNHFQLITPSEGAWSIVLETIQAALGMG